MFLFKKKSYALIGRSGTGKSFRAQFVAAKYNIPLIIDDGLLISGDRIVAGKSAKQSLNFMQAIKYAVFKDTEHRNEVYRALQKENFRKILILGTSEKMVQSIIDTLKLPPLYKVIKIEDIATPEEIETAMKVRYSEGQHVIPVNPVQITRSYPDIAYNSIKVGIVKKILPFGLRKKVITQEKTVVKTEFTKTEDRKTISSAALKQMITHCLYEYEATMKIEDVSYTLNDSGYLINVDIRTPVHLTKVENQELELYIRDSLEKYAEIMVYKVNLKITEWK